MRLFAKIGARSAAARKVIILALFAAFYQTFKLKLPKNGKLKNGNIIFRLIRFSLNSVLRSLFDGSIFEICGCWALSRGRHRLSRVELCLWAFSRASGPSKTSFGTELRMNSRYSDGTDF